MTQQDCPAPSLPAPADGEPHHITTAENGAFCMARCTCGWRGPARRARSLARTDAERHTQN